MATGKIELVKSTKEAIDYIADHLRAVDVVELADTGINDAPGWLRQAFDEGEVACIATLDGRPMAAFCVHRQATEASVMTPKHYCWLSGTDDVEKAGFGGMIKSVYNIKRVMECFGHLFTFVRDDNLKATRYIKALGFQTDGRKVSFNGKPATYWERIK